MTDEAQAVVVLNRASRVGWVIANLTVLASAILVFMLMIVGIGMTDADYASIHPMGAPPSADLSGWHWAVVMAVILNVPAIACLVVGRLRPAWVFGFLPYAALFGWVAVR